MQEDCTYLSYKDTNYFSSIALDYLQQSSQLQPFYQHPVSIDGIRLSIANRQQFNTNRTLLVDELRKQYNGLPLSKKQEDNLLLLLQPNTYTITTAHQPNIFTGPLFFIYKIIHAIKLADELNKQLTEYKFVPVYYMGSEDADLDELGYINLAGEKYSWQTKQTGAVGRMKVDKSFLQLIDSIEGRIGTYPFGEELIATFKQCYTEGKSIQQATLELVNALFASYGLLVLIPDNASFKKAFSSVIEKELTEQFSHKAVKETITELGKHYEVQAGGRDINMFYLKDDKRERITIQNSKFKIQNLGIEFTKEEILNEFNNHPERFSPNVILRGVLQETILPNIAFIGGGGELAYWLELKKVFEEAHVPYPMLLLRNSFLLMGENKLKQWNKLGFTVTDLFKDINTLIDQYVRKNTENDISLEGEKEDLQRLYDMVISKVAYIDVTLSEHVLALEHKHLNKLNELEKKILRAEKRKFEEQQKQINCIKKELFPDNNLQERVQNMSLYYALYGKDWLDKIYNASKGLEPEFGIIQMHCIKQHQNC